MAAYSRRDFLKGSLAAGAGAGRARWPPEHHHRAGQGAGQDRRAPLALRHDGDQRGVAARRRADGGRRDQRQGRGAWAKKIEPVVVDPASNWDLFAEKAKQLLCRTRSPSRSAAGRRSAASPCCRCSRTTTACSSTPCSTRARSAVEERLLHRRHAQPAAHPRRRVPDGEGGRRLEEVLPARHRLRLPAHRQQDPARLPAGQGRARGRTSRRSTRRSTIRTTRRSSARSSASPPAATPACSPRSTATATCPSTRSSPTRACARSTCPIMAFSVAEDELRGMDTSALVGHLAAWNYYQSVDTPQNKKFVQTFKAYAKKNNLPGGDKRVTDDPIEAAYFGVYVWKQAVEKAGVFDVDEVRKAVYGHGVPGARRQDQDGRGQPAHLQAGADRRDPQGRPVQGRLALQGPREGRPVEPVHEPRQGL